jgi:serine/threonine protein kinase
MDGLWNTKWIEIEPLGGGGQGDTFLVKSAGEGSKRVVLKLLKGHKVQDAKARRRMFQEVTNLKILRSAGGKVPEVLDGNTDVFEDINLPMYFVMEHIQGNTLADLIQQSSGLPVETSVGIALELCSTVRIAIKEAIVHRDIKPENIIVRSTTAPDVVMVDFGLSFNEDEDHKLTSADESLDNKFLSLPERRGPDENKRDPRSDLTGICAILHYCLTKCVPRNLRDSQGRLPHQLPNYSLSGKVQDEAQRAALNLLLNRGLNYEIDSRFQTIDELTNRLEEILKPGAKEIIEDLETILVRETAALRKNDRKTQLNEYFRNVQLLQQSMLLRFHETQAMLQKHKDFFYLIIPNSMSFEKLYEKTQQGDLVGRAKFGCGAHNHDIFLQIHYTVVAHGSECSIYREFQEGQFHVQPKPVDLPTLVLRYNGDLPLSTHDAAEFVADMDKAVKKAITIISQKIQNIN